MSDKGESLPIKYGAVRLTGPLDAYADFTPEKRTDPSPNAARFAVSARLAATLLTADEYRRLEALPPV